MEFIASYEPESVSFRVVESDRMVSPDIWASYELQLPVADRRTLRQLRMLIEEERAWVADDGTVLVTHPTIARLSGLEAAALRLPEPVSFTLQVQSQGTIDQPSFRISWRFLDTLGRPILNTQRIGAILRIGKRSCRLPEPFYSFLEAIDEFNTAPSDDMKERFLAMGRIRALLPEECILDDYLDSTRIVHATAFTLEPYIDANGKLTFDPVLMRQAVPTVDQSHENDLPSAATTPPYVNALPDHYQRCFAQQFRERSGDSDRYALSDGWYVFLDEPLRRALAVARRVQLASESERRAFLANPYAVLQGEIGQTLEQLRPEGLEPEEFLSSLFVEPPSYGERVKGVGAWTPKVIPWVARPSSPWLPPERVGLAIGPDRVELDRAQLPALRQEIEEAIAAGCTSVKVGEAAIPATREVSEAIRTLEETVSQPLTWANAEPDSKGQRRQAVLIIEDNLEAVTYAPAPRQHRTKESDIEDVLLSRFKPHQREGFEWLKSHWINGSRGALLADDMGLGKTLQALAFLAWVRQEMEAGYVRRQPLLVVAPTGLLRNWEDEHSKHLRSPGLGHLVRLYGEGLKRTRRTSTIPVSRGAELETGGAVLDRTMLERADWVLTTYETLRDYQHSFGLTQWAVIVFDEAQKIKSPGTLMTEAAKAMQAEFVLAMTGTPVENRLADLWCIVDTVQPALLGDLKAFSKEYEKDNTDEEALRALKQKVDQHEPEPPPRPKVMLRRLKGSDLKGLPPKEEHILRAEMPPLQARQYAAVVENAYTKGVARQLMLQVIHQLRSVSLHPLAFADIDDDETYIASSARLAETIRVLDEIAGKQQKALVFVDSIDFQTALQALLQRRYNMARPPWVISGVVSGEHRKRRVDEFQATEGFAVMILSPRAGGVGLTLTTANHVIHLSRWWNPAVEDQCSDRVYRIGQERPVHIYFPIAVHPDFGEYSFDVQLDGLLRRKRSLSNTLLTPAQLTDDDLRHLFEATAGGRVRTGSREW